VTTGFASLTFYSATRLFWQDKKKSLPKVTGNFLGIYLIGKMFVQLLPEYLSYFKADFHPSEIDYSEIVNMWKQRLATEYLHPEFQKERSTGAYS